MFKCCIDIFLLLTIGILFLLRIGLQLFCILQQTAINNGPFSIKVVNFREREQTTLVMLDRFCLLIKLN